MRDKPRDRKDIKIKFDSLKPAVIKSLQKQMQDQPLNSFMMRTECIGSIEMSVLFSLMAMQEVSFPISPAARTRMWPVSDLTPEQLSAAIDKLIQAGEVEVYDDGKVRGFAVVRFDDFQDSMMDFGRRRYQRLMGRKSRERKKALKL